MKERLHGIHGSPREMSEREIRTTNLFHDSRCIDERPESVEFFRETRREVSQRGELAEQF